MCSLANPAQVERRALNAANRSVYVEAPDVVEHPWTKGRLESGAAADDRMLGRRSLHTNAFARARRRSAQRVSEGSTREQN